MESSLFLTADEQPLTLGQALRYLESAGKLECVLWEIMRSYVIEQELQTLEKLDISSELDQVVLDFRLENELTNYASFQQWLGNQGLDYPTFRSHLII